MINVEILQQYTDAFVLYEIATHGVDPRKTLDGTIMRIKSEEGYKADVFMENQARLSQGGPYSDIIIDALPGYNLVSFYQKNRIVENLKKKGTDDFESALTLLYEGDDDENAFHEIVNSIGGAFDVLGFIFFLKDDTKYMPIRSKLFDERFSKLGIESGLEGNCTWEKYQKFISLIEEVQSFLNSEVNQEITLLDAHSFLWVLPGLEEYLDSNAQIVEHKMFGKGVVLGFENDLIICKFGKKTVKLLKDLVFNEGILKFEQSGFRLGDDKEKKTLSNTLNSILKKAGIDPNRTKLIRHALSDEQFRKCWDAGYVYEYTCIQDKENFKDSDTWIVFVSGEGTTAVLDGCYKVKGEQPNIPDTMPQGFPCPEMFDGQHSFYDLEKMDQLKAYEGKLVIEWGAGTRAWRQNVANEKEIISENGALDYKPTKPPKKTKSQKRKSGLSIFYVFQGETYEEEHAGGYVWSPQLNKSGGKNAGYEMMTNIRKGDFILHNSNGKIMSISVAQSDCYEANQPRELSEANTTVEWDDVGYRVDTKYYDFDVPLITTNHTAWLADHYIEGSAFTRVGRGKQQYMCHLADEHAIYLLEKAIELQESDAVLNNLKAALVEIVGDKNSEYDQIEMESIDQIIQETKDAEKPEWTGEKETQAMTTSSQTGRDIPKRDPQRAADALAHAGYLCEYDNTDRTFLRKNGKPYTEPHHLIPISKYRDFEYSVDVMENIVSLCSHCHNLLHYGRFEDKKPILVKLYNDRKEALANCGLEMTLEELESYYK